MNQDEPKSQTSAVNSNVQSAHNSNQKKSKRGGYRGRNTQNPLTDQNFRSQNSKEAQDYRTLSNEQFEALKEQYQNVDGACDWFTMKKQELEKGGSNGQQSSSLKKNNGVNLHINHLPIYHQWRPPRIDQVKYQVDGQNIPENSHQVAQNQSPKQIQQDLADSKVIGDLEEGKQQQQVVSVKINIDSKILGKKRIVRSSSFDLDEVKDFVPRRKVIFDGEPLIQDLDEQKKKESQIIKDSQVKTSEKENEKDRTHEKIVYDTRDPLNNDLKLTDYLELCDFIMKETHNTNCNGLWLKGSLAGYQEKAMKLLHEYNYNYNLAKFHILYPTVMAIPEQREEILNSLTEQELESIVNDAVIDLRGCKSIEAEDAISNIRNDMRTNRITVEELGHYQQMLKKLRVEMPSDIEQEFARGRDFSKLIKKKCGPQTGGGAAAQIPYEKKMKLSEITNMYNESLEYQIITPEMQQLSEYLKKSQQWIEKAEQLKNQVVNVKQLQNILAESRSIPVNFEGLFEELRKRSIDSSNLVEKIHQAFIKVNKTRTQVNQEQQNTSTSKERKKLQDQQKKEKQKKEQQFKDLLGEADILMITNPEIQKLREHVDDIERWKCRVLMFLEDESEQKNRKEVFNQLIKETALFKYDVDLTEDLQRRLEFLEWFEKVEKVYNQLGLPSKQASPLSSVQQSQAYVEEEKKEIEHIDTVMKEEYYTQKIIEDQQAVQKVPLSQIQSIMQEGESKGFSDIQLEKIIKVGEICLKANLFETKLSKILKDIKDISSSSKDIKPKVDMSKLIELKEESENLRVYIEEMNELDEIIQEVKDYELKCQEFIDKSKFLNEDIMEIDQVQQNEQSLQNPREFLKQILQLRLSITKLGVKNKTFKVFKRIIKPLLRWIRLSRLIIKNYHKSLSSEVASSFSQLNLLDQQDYESESSSDELLDEEIINTESTYNNSTQCKFISKLEQQYDLLNALLAQADQSFKLLQKTSDYSILTKIKGKVDNWLSKQIQIEEERNKFNKDIVIDEEIQKPIVSENNQQIIEQLEELDNEHLPVPTEYKQRVQKVLRREKWLRKLKDLYQNERVKIKQVESLVKDSNHNDIQEDVKCKALSDLLKTQLQTCRDWLQVQSSADLTLQKDIMKLLDQGKKHLKLNLTDYVDLRNFHQDVLEWKEKTQQILENGIGKQRIQNVKPEAEGGENYESVRKHIDMGVGQLDIQDKEIDVLKSIVEMSAHWKSIARKILKSRELCQLKHKNIIVKDVFGLAQIVDNLEETKQDNQQSNTDQSLQLKQLMAANDKPMNSLKPFVPNTYKKPITLYEYFDNQQYCICRRGDDGFAFMIECDCCKEWFHGDCVGISKQVGNKITQYICVGCARVIYNYDLVTQGVVQSKGVPQGEEFDKLSGIQQVSEFHLDIFSVARRAQYQQLQDLIQEGETNIPIFLEEMEELKEVEYKVEQWLDNIQPFLSQSPVEDLCEEYSQSENTDSMLINTQINKQQQQLQQKYFLDQNTLQILKFYLESEAFPVELSESEELLLILKQRRWYQEVRKAVNRTASGPKWNKVQFKKNIKRLIGIAQELKVHTDEKLLQMYEALQMQLAGQQQQQPSTQSQQHQLPNTQQQYPHQQHHQHNYLQPMSPQVSYQQQYQYSDQFQQNHHQMQHSYSQQIIPSNNHQSQQQQRAKQHQMYHNEHQQQQIQSQQIPTQAGGKVKSHYIQKFSQKPTQQMSQKTGQIAQQQMIEQSHKVSLLEQEWDGLFESNQADYLEIEDFIDRVEAQCLAQSEEEIIKMQGLKNTLQEYQEWLLQVNVFLNSADAHIQDYERLIDKGQRYFYMILSKEKFQFESLQDHYYRWYNKAVDLYGNFEKADPQAFLNPSNIKYNVRIQYYSNTFIQQEQIGQLLNEYKQKVPFESFPVRFSNPKSKFQLQHECLTKIYNAITQAVALNLQNQGQVLNQPDSQDQEMDLESEIQPELILAVTPSKSNPTQQKTMEEDYLDHQEEQKQMDLPEAEQIGIIEVDNGMADPISVQDFHLNHDMQIEEQDIEKMNADNKNELSNNLMIPKESIPDHDDFFK